MANRKKYAIVGTGGRCALFYDALVHTWKEHAQLVALCDISQTRMNYYNRRGPRLYDAAPVPTYLAGDFDQMIRREKPQVVIVTTMDCVHHQYIIRAMELGCDVISEKPLTTNAAHANAILQAMGRTGRSLRVTFNYRYAPLVTKTWELLRQGVVGRPLDIDFSWVLDTRHGADYFRRWHREKDKSGGLLVHKASHHFDLVNWWLGSTPRTVFAMGGLKFYGKAAARARGQSCDYPRYTHHPAAKGDPFALFLDSSEHLRTLYLEAESDSGYIRDRNVFGEPITIEDTMAVLVRYQNNVILNYSLVAYSPWEGFRVAITGDKGRLELFEKHGSHIIAGQSDAELAAEQAAGHQQSLCVFPMFGKPYNVAVPKGEGGHGGGDPIMLEQIFSPKAPPDPYRRAASHLDGVAAILVGISADQSMCTQLPIDCDTLIDLANFQPAQRSRDKSPDLQPV